MSSTVRLYFSDKIKSDLLSHLTREQSHYLKDVMRLKIGDKLSIFNNQGEWRVSIESYEKKNAVEPAPRKKILTIKEMLNLCNI